MNKSCQAAQVADFLDRGDPIAAPAWCHQMGIDSETWRQGVALSEQRRLKRTVAELQAVGEKYEVRYREGSNGWWSWIRTYAREYAEGQFEALRLRPVVAEAELRQGELILDSFRRELLGPPESAMRRAA